MMTVPQTALLIASLAVHEIAGWRLRESIASSGHGVIPMMYRGRMRAVQVAAMSGMGVILCAEVPPLIDPRFTEGLLSVCFGVTIAFLGIILKTGADAAKTAFFARGVETKYQRFMIASREAVVVLWLAAVPIIAFAVAAP